MSEPGDGGQRAELPEAPIDRLVGPLARFLHIEATSGIVLLFFTAAALALANSPFADAFLGIWKIPLGFEVGEFQVSHSLKHWINDGLMAVFFFVIGLEVKREIVLGELRDIRRAALPIAAALGGMVVPAGIYLSLQAGQPAEAGWGIPMATDIAFVVGCMAVLGSRIRHGRGRIATGMDQARGSTNGHEKSVFAFIEPRNTCMLAPASRYQMASAGASVGE